MQDNVYVKSRFVVFFPISLMIVCLASIQIPVTLIAQEQREKVIRMTASNYRFEPSTIQARKGDALLIEVENASSQEHNLTIRDPQGRTIESVKLPAKETTKVKVSLAEAGTYAFLCDKYLHPRRGMKGRIDAQ